ncbi:MAG: hypothetical protein ABIH84_01290 [bacterium]
MSVRKGELGGMGSVPGKKEADRIRERRDELLEDPNSYTYRTPFGSVEILNGTKPSSTEMAKIEKWRKESEKNFESAKQEFLEMLNLSQKPCEFRQEGWVDEVILTEASILLFFNDELIGTVGANYDSGPKIPNETRYSYIDYGTLFGRPLLVEHFLKFSEFAKTKTEEKNIS